MQHGLAVHPVVEVPVVVGGKALAADDCVCDGDALGEDRGVVIGVWVRGGVSQASQVGHTVVSR